MNLLLDSHAVVWWLNDDFRLPQPARNVLRDTTNGAYISAVSFWELSIKISIGKLSLGPGWIDRLYDRMGEDALDYLHIRPTHCKAVHDMPFHHRDPFDRMLAAQGQCEALTIVSRDKVFDDYGVERIW